MNGPSSSSSSVHDDVKLDDTDGAWFPTSQRYSCPFGCQQFSTETAKHLRKRLRHHIDSNPALRFTISLDLQQFARVAPCSECWKLHSICRTLADCPNRPEYFDSSTSAPPTCPEASIGLIPILCAYCGDGLRESAR